LTDEAVGKIFISYSHDSPEHSARVLVLSNQLRALGVDVELDRYHVRPLQGWPHWCEEQLRPGTSSFVLVICTPTYRERVEDLVGADEGRGVYWEGAIVYNYLYSAKGNSRFIPVLLDEVTEAAIPLPLDGHTRYRIRAFEFADSGFEAIYRELNGQPETPKPTLGNVIKFNMDAAPLAAKPMPEKEAVTDFVLDGRPLDTSSSRVSSPAELTAIELPTITGVQAKSGNYSIWVSAGEILTHNDAFGGAKRQKVAIPDVPRAYMRIVPAGWSNGIPSISDIATLNQSERVDAPSDRARDGDFGATEEGFVRYWITDWLDPRQASSTNVTMFFEDTGEFWMLHGTVVDEDRGQRLLADRGMLRQWSRMLRTAMVVMDRFRAKKIRRVEAGLFGVKDILWISDWGVDRIPSRRNDTRETRQNEDWTPEAQLTFLTNAYNRVRNLFALERMPEAEVTRILRQFDPERFRAEV
jgi:hypothetical protein